MENSKIAALVELGILCRGEPVEVHGDGSADPGPHILSEHEQLCRFEWPEHQFPFEDKSVPAYALYPPDMTLEAALPRTRLVVMLGVADSPEMRTCLASMGTIVVLYEPDERVLVEYLEKVKLMGMNRENFFCFTGNPLSFNPALQDLLPGDMFRMGTPAFFMTERIRDEYGDWAHQVIEYFEILHYRHAIYPIAGQGLNRSQPVRNIHRGLLYDQQVHAYENLGDFLTRPPIAHLRNRMKGLPAILVAAGPDLSGKFEYIRANRDKAVIICVNNAVKPLVEAGIEPHIVIINDNSLESGQVFKHIPELPGTLLVAHCLSDTGGDRFRHKYLFGSFLPNLFGERKMLKLHGSVISCAFSLALHLGCSKSILVGAQLASDNPWGLGYAKGTVGKDVETKERPLIGMYPQLYPVTTPFGEQLYTTLNFRDAALWLAETIRLSGMECVNTSRSSLVYGDGIEYDPEPELEECAIDKVMAPLFRLEAPRVDREGVLRYLNHELSLWKSVRGVAQTMLNESGPALVAKGMAILDQLDKNNVTYLVERRNPFVNRDFNEMVFRGDESSREEGLKYYFEHVFDMSQQFLKLLEKAAREI